MDLNRTMKNEAGSTNTELKHIKLCHFKFQKMDESVQCSYWSSSVFWVKMALICSYQCFFKDCEKGRMRGISGTVSACKD